MKETYQKMHLVERVSKLSTSGVFLNIQVPVKHFLGFMLARLEQILNVEFYFTPEVTSDEEFKYIKKLTYLSKLGIVTDFWKVKREYTDEPYMHAVNVRLTGNKHHGYSGYGRSLYGYDKAWGPAYGEALERWCVENFEPPQSEKRILTTLDLFNSPARLDLLALPGIGSDVRDLNTLKYDYKILPDSKFVCVETEELTSQQKHFVPLQWFSFKHTREYIHTKKEPVIGPIITTGAAAGRTQSEAILSGIYECLERDAFSIYWLCRLTPKKVPLSLANSADTKKIIELTGRFNLKCYFLYLQTDFPVHTVLCLVIDETGVGPYVTVDTNTGTDISSCILKSFMGAVGQREHLRHRWGIFSKENKDLSSEDLNSRNRLLWWYKTDRKHLLDFLISGPEIDEIPNYPNLSVDSNLAIILKALSAKGYKTYCKNLLPPALSKKIKEAVVFVKIPNLIPMHLSEIEKTTVGDRLCAISNSINPGVAFNKVNDTPHPFS